LHSSTIAVSQMRLVRHTIDLPSASCPTLPRSECLPVKKPASGGVRVRRPLD
jgi:hypothetical protein